LVETVRHDLGGADGTGTSTAVKMIWTADHLDAVRRLEGDTVGAARAVATRMRAQRGPAPNPAIASQASG